MFLEKAFFKGNEFWKYLIGLLVLFIAYIVGQIPFTIAVFYQLKQNGDTFFGKSQEAIMKVLDKNLGLFLMLLSFVFAFLAFLGIVKWLHQQKLKDVVTSRAKIDWNRFFFSFIVWGCFQMLVTVGMYFSSPEDFVWNFQWQPFLILCVIACLLLPIQTSLEELVFRGYLMQGFGLIAKNKWIPLVFTSVLFGGMHYFNPEVEKLGPVVMVYYIGTGLFLGIMTLMDEGMELSLGFHASNNLVTALLVTTDWSVLQTYSVLKDVSKPDVGFEVLAPVVFVFPALLLLFAKKYHWSNWNEKLFGKIYINRADARN